VAGLDIAWCRGLAARALTAGSLAEVSELLASGPDAFVSGTA
jgi:hypothetical protein